MRVVDFPLGLMTSLAIGSGLHNSDCCVSFVEWKLNPIKSVVGCTHGGYVPYNFLHREYIIHIHYILFITHMITYLKQIFVSFVNVWYSYVCIYACIFIQVHASMFALYVYVQVRGLFCLTSTILHQNL